MTAQSRLCLFIFFQCSLRLLEPARDNVQQSLSRIALKQRVFQTKIEKQTRCWARSCFCHSFWVRRHLISKQTRKSMASKRLTIILQQDLLRGQLGFESDPHCLLALEFDNPSLLRPLNVARPASVPPSFKTSALITSFSSQQGGKGLESQN